MTSRRKAANQVLAAAAGTTIYNLSQWFLLIVIARFATTEDVGLYSYALAVTAPLALLFGLNLRSSYITEDLNRNTFAAYYRLRMFTSLCLTTLFIVLALTLNSGGIVIFAVGLAKTLDLITDFLLSPLQKAGKLAAIGVVQALNGLLTFSAAFSCLLIKIPADVAISTTAMGSLITLLYASRLVRHNHSDIQPAVRIRWWRNELTQIPRLRVRTLLVSLLPLGIAAGVASARITFPRYLLENSWGLEEIGIYSAALHVTVAANALVMAISQLVLPRFVAVCRKGGARALRGPVFAAAAAWIGFGGLITVAAHYFGPWAISLIYGSEYVVEHLMWILAIAWGVSSAGTMIELGLLAQRKFRSQLYANLVSFAITAVAAIVLVPKYGMLGAGWAGVISAFAFLLANAAFFVTTLQRGPTNPDS